MQPTSVSDTRDYLYCFKYSDFIGISFSAVFFGCLSLSFLLFIATHEGGPIESRRWGRIEEGQAKALFYSMSAITGLIAFTTAWFAWKAVPTKQRIVLTASGLLFPRTRFSAKEEFVAYEEIAQILEEESEINGQKRVTFLHLDTTQGRFSIARQKLKESDFEEIREFLFEKITGEKPLALLAGLQQPAPNYLPPAIAWGIFISFLVVAGMFMGYMFYQAR